MVSASAAMPLATPIFVPGYSPDVVLAGNFTGPLRDVEGGGANSIPKIMFTYQLTKFGLSLRTGSTVHTNLLWNESLGVLTQNSSSGSRVVAHGRLHHVVDRRRALRSMPGLKDHHLDVDRFDQSTLDVLNAAIAGEASVRELVGAFDRANVRAAVLEQGLSLQ